MSAGESHVRLVNPRSVSLKNAVPRTWTVRPDSLTNGGSAGAIEIRSTVSIECPNVMFT